MVVSNKEMDDIMKIVKSLGELGLLINDVGGTNKNEVKEQKPGFLGVLPRTLSPNLFGNILLSEKVIQPRK